MAINVIERIEIASTQKHVAEYMFNPENDLTWISGIRQVLDISNLPIQIGTKVHRIATFLGKEIDYVLEVVDFEQNHFLKMEAIKSPFPMEVTYQVDNLEKGTSIAQITIKGSTKGFFMFMERLMSIMVSHSIKGDLGRLRDIMEDMEEPQEDVDHQNQ